MNNNSAFLAARAEYSNLCAENQALHKRMLLHSDEAGALISLSARVHSVGEDAVVGDLHVLKAGVKRAHALATENERLLREHESLSERLSLAVYELIRTSAKASEAP